MTAKELVGAFTRLNNLSLVDYPYQMRIAKSLVERYTEKELMYALEQYKGMMYSLGFLSEKNMVKAKEKIREQINIEYKVGGDIAERNRNKLQRCTDERWKRERYYFDMLEE